MAAFSFASIKVELPPGLRNQIGTGWEVSKPWQVIFDYHKLMLLAWFADKNFNIVAAIISILVLLVCSIPLGFLIAFVLKKWHERHPIEEAENEKKPLKLND